jgi:hypothetical protein
MQDRVYYTGSDARLVFLNHPEHDLTGRPLDAAHYVLTAGSSPVHIWNYARQQDGGAKFDDTAIGNHLADLQLVMNQERFEKTEDRFRDHSGVGDMLLLYETTANWGASKTAGYRLLDGHVGSVGEEITLKNATYPTVSLKFKEAVPYGSASQQRAGSGEGGILELGAEGEVPGGRVKYWPIEGYYADNGVSKAFAPGRTGAPSGTPLEASQFARFRRHPAQYVSLGQFGPDSFDQWLKAQKSAKDFAGAFLEVARRRPKQSERQLYAWHTAERQYKNTGRASGSARTPILEAD